MGPHPFGGRVSRHFGSSLRPDDKYLSYHDVTLLKEDMSTLKSSWLTDNIIAFWEEYLEHEFLTNFTHSRIRLLRPAMAQMLKFSPDPREFLSQPKPPNPNDKDSGSNVTRDVGVLGDFEGVTHIFVPINDCDDPNAAEGGSHWSLLLVSIVDGVAFHYDSLMHNNQASAYEVTRKLSVLLGTRSRSNTATNTDRREESAYEAANRLGQQQQQRQGRDYPIRFIELQDTPQQDNSSDCGVYLCLFMKHLLLKRLLMVRTSEKVSMSLGEKRIDAREGRKEMARVIEERRKEGERRRSLSKSPGPGRKSRSPPRIGDPGEEDHRPRSSSSRR